jgi:hypothetical protein
MPYRSTPPALSARPAGRRRLGALVVAAGLVFTACGGGDDNGSDAQSTTTTAAGPDQVDGSVASYDLAVGPASRFMFGMFNQAKGPIGYGTAQLSFFFLGENEAAGEPQPGPTATGTYLPLPGSPPAPGDASKAVYLPTEERGVYAAQVAFDRPGFWGVAAVVDLDGRKEVKKAFKVAAKPAVPMPGDAALPTQNLTVSTPGAAPQAIDSRASANTPVPDPELHETTVAQALAEKRPVLLTISTPTYCVSVFCGPITDMVAELAEQYGDRARFIHVEVWKNYEAKELNEAAKEWIAQGPDVNEPWVFLIGADGKIAARFDNIATRPELEALLKALPPMKS